MEGKLTHSVWKTIKFMTLRTCVHNNIGKHSNYLIDVVKSEIFY